MIGKMIKFVGWHWFMMKYKLHLAKEGRDFVVDEG